MSSLKGKEKQGARLVLEAGNSEKASVPTNFVQWLFRNLTVSACFTDDPVHMPIQL